MKRFLFLFVSLMCNTYLFADDVGTEFTADVNGIKIIFTITNTSDDNCTVKVGLNKGNAFNSAVTPYEVSGKKSTYQRKYIIKVRTIL